MEPFKVENVPVKRVLVSLPTEVVKTLDEMKRTYRLSRTELICRMVEYCLNNQEEVS